MAQAASNVQVVAAGADTVLVYGGSLAPETVRTATEGLTDQIRTLREETP